MKPSQVRVVDPILSRHARGWRQAELVGTTLFPLAPVPAYGGQVIEFGKESFKLYNSKRAPGSNTKRVGFGYAGKPYSIVPSALEASVPREWLRDASQVPGINLGTRAVNTVLRSLHLEHEVACATLAREAAAYDSDHKLVLVGADRWTGGSSDPTEDVEAAKEAIRASIGLHPNTGVISPRAYAACKTNAKILDRVKYVGGKVTLEALASLWEIEHLKVGKAVVAGDDDAFGDVWGNDVVLGYVSPTGGADVDASIDEPSAAYTYLIEGHPSVEDPYWDNNTKSWVYGVSYDNTPVVAARTAMFLIQNAGAPAA